MHKVPHAALRILLLALALTGLAVRTLGQEMTISVPIQPNYNYNPAISTMYFLGSQARFAPLMQFQSAAPIGPVQHTVGTGLSDLTSGGTGSFAGLTALVSHVFQIKLCAAGSPDTFDFGVDAPATCGVPTAIVAGLANPLANGVTVTFKAATGHAAGDQWQINAFAPHQEEWLNLGSGWNGSSWNTPGTPQCWADLNGQLDCVGGILNPITLQTNTVNNFSQTLLNLVNGTGISIVNTSGGNVQISSTSGACPYTDPFTETDFYVDPAGSDSTGNGSIGNPWQHIQFAINQIPGIVCQLYVIHLKSAGTYPATDPVQSSLGIHLDGRIFSGGGVGGYNSTAPALLSWPWESAWVEIVGNTAAPDTFIISPPGGGTGACTGTSLISVSNANLVIRGVSIRNGGIGLIATGSNLELPGDTFQNNCAHWIFSDNTNVLFQSENGVADTVNQAGVYYDEIRDVGPYSGNLAFQLLTGAMLTDLPADGGTGGHTPPYGIHITGSGSVAAGLRAIVQDGSKIQMPDSQMFFDTAALSAGQIYGLNAIDHSQVVLDTYKNNGNSALTNNLGSGVGLSQNSTMDTVGSGAGRGFVISNLLVGVNFDGTSRFNAVTSAGYTLTNVANPYSQTFYNLQSEQQSASMFLAAGGLFNTLIYSATPAISLQNGSTVRITLTGNAAPTIANGFLGETVIFHICQDGAGGHTWTWPAEFHGAGTVGNTASTCSVQSFYVDAVTGGGDPTLYALGPMVTGM